MCILRISFVTVMVGVAGKSKGYNTCRKRKIHVCIDPCVAVYLHPSGTGTKSVVV